MGERHQAAGKNGDAENADRCGLVPRNAEPAQGPHGAGTKRREADAPEKTRIRALYLAFMKEFPLKDASIAQIHGYLKKLAPKDGYPLPKDDFFTVSVLEDIANDQRWMHKSLLSYQMLERRLQLVPAGIYDGLDEAALAVIRSHDWYYFHRTLVNARAVGLERGDGDVIVWKHHKLKFEGFRRLIAETKSFSEAVEGKGEVEDIELHLYGSSDRLFLLGRVTKQGKRRSPGERLFPKVNLHLIDVELAFAGFGVFDSWADSSPVLTSCLLMSESAAKEKLGSQISEAESGKIVREPEICRKLDEKWSKLASSSGIRDALPAWREAGGRPEVWHDRLLQRLHEGPQSASSGSSRPQAQRLTSVRGPSA